MKWYWDHEHGWWYDIILRLTCVLWYRHPEKVKGSWYSSIYLTSGTRCKRCGAWLSKGPSVCR